VVVGGEKKKNENSGGWGGGIVQMTNLFVGFQYRSERERENLSISLSIMCKLVKQIKVLNCVII